MTDWNHEVFREAGLETRHLAPFFPVTRETISGWLNGRRGPAHLIAPAALAMQRAVTTALDRGELPVKPRSDLSKAERDLRINRVLYRYLQREEDAATPDT